MTGLISLAVIVALIIAEITVFGLIGSAIGALLTIIGVFVTAAVGLRLFRHFGRGTLRRMAEASQAGRAPVAEVADGIAIMVAAFLLLIPGYVTDMLGVIFFIPGLRVFLVVVVLGSVLSRLSTRHFATAAHTGFDPSNNPFHDMNADPSVSQDDQMKKDASNVTIEGEFERKD